MSDLLELQDTFGVWREKINDFANQTNEGFKGQFEASVNGLNITLKAGRVRTGSTVEAIPETTLTLPPTSTKVVCIVTYDDQPAELLAYDVLDVPSQKVIPLFVVQTSTTIDDVEDLRTQYVIASAAGGSSIEGAILLLDSNITEDYTIPVGKNALSVSPTVDPGVTVEVPPESIWAIV